MDNNTTISFSKTADNRVLDIFYTPVESQDRESVVSICYTVSKQISFIFSGKARNMVNLVVEQ